MTRVSSRLLRSLPSLSSKRPLKQPVYHLGLSYASKSSPPFVVPSTRPNYGYASYKGKDEGARRISEWVNRSMERRAGRGLLSEGEKGGWSEEVRKEVKKWGAGEDSFAIVEDVSSDAELYGSAMSAHLAISDGVGGWSDVVDPSCFSQALMYHYADATSSKSTLLPQSLLKTAYAAVLEEQSVVAGSATACSVFVGDDGTIRGVNMGDSGCSIIRNEGIALATPSLTHYFNCPKQLSKIPNDMAAGGIVMDLPDEKATDTFEAQLEANDVVVLYTDGLADNVPQPHILHLLSHLRAFLSSPSNAHLSSFERNAELARLYADVLVAYGRSAMVRTGEEVEEDGKGGKRVAWRTPFEEEAEKEGQTFKGGKVDDITVITAVVSERYPDSD